VTNGPQAILAVIRQTAWHCRMQTGVLIQHFLPLLLLPMILIAKGGIPRESAEALRRQQHRAKIIPHTGLPCGCTAITALASPRPRWAILWNAQYGVAHHQMSLGRSAQRRILSSRRSCVTKSNEWRGSGKSTSAPNRTRAGPHVLADTDQASFTRSDSGNRKSNSKPQAGNERCATPCES
jgi:hypothetical protein